MDAALVYYRVLQAAKQSDFMQFNITIDQQLYTLDIPEAVIEEAQAFIADMDRDFDRGLQLGRYWIDEPSAEQRCQIAANKIVNALHQENVRQFYIMAAYILHKFPGLKMVTVDSDYEIDEIDIVSE